MLEPEVWENKGLVDVKSEGNNLFGIFYCQPLGLLQLQVLPEKLLIIGQLYHQGNVKSVLQPPKTLIEIKANLC